jgi:flagellar hook-associated protein 3 FlgL
MSGSITMTGVTGYATLTRLIKDSQTIHQKLDNLSNQASTGLVGDTYAGLGTGASVSLDLRPQVANLQTWQKNIDAATGRLSVAQSALTQIQSIASKFYAQLNNMEGVGSSEVDTIATSARDALKQVAGLLDTQDGGVYVFAGQDTGNPPVPNPDNVLTSGFYFQINAAVGALNTTGAAATAMTTYAVATSNVPGTSPFSTWLSQTSTTLQAHPPVVQIGQNQTELVGIPDSANGLIPDSPPGPATIPGGPPVSTGSYMRDVLRALATIGSLTNAQADDPGFQSLLQDTRISLSSAANALAQDTGVLGNVQSSLTATQSRLADAQTALTGQVSSAEDVDMAVTLSQLSLVQTQMQASYQLIATLNGLSLAKFLPIGA